MKNFKKFKSKRRFNKRRGSKRYGKDKVLKHWKIQRGGTRL